ncbi:MAG: endonuclease/exonuclease/phosphatase family protein [Ruminococcaceae bacterium]|nr:endonuclease/exonuclease/phosphatase family protein [Oscillospiraceae bacterium]
MKIKVMTFNIRCKNPGDGINSFDNRKERILNAIVQESPDLIGFQEVTDAQRNFLKENISDKYTLLGCGRDANYYGEAVCIAFKRELFDLISFETFWLSSTPKLAGSIYEGSDQSNCPRFTTYAKLIAKELTEPIHFFNTHLDHQGEIAKLLGITQIIQKISECKGKFLLTGDFNANPDSEVISAIKAVKSPCFKDATENLDYTFHAFGQKSAPCKIDYIFTNGNALDSHTVSDNPDDGIYISDHFPVCANIEI